MVSEERLALVARYNGWTVEHLVEEAVERFLQRFPPDEHLERIIPVLEARALLPPGLR